MIFSLIYTTAIIDKGSMVCSALGPEERSAEMNRAAAKREKKERTKMKTHSLRTVNRHLVSRQMKQLHRGERKHVKEIFAWANKSSIDSGDRDRICERARQLNSAIDMSRLSDGFRFADEVNSLFREIEQLDPIGYAKMQSRLTKRLQKKS